MSETMTGVTVRPFEMSDFDALMDLWARALPLDPITASDLRRRVLLCEHCDRQSLMVAAEGSRLLGFVLNFWRRFPLGTHGIEPERAFITMFGVDPLRRREGIATRLFNAVEENLRALGKRRVAIAPFPENYFIPGVDVEADAVKFLEGRGYQRGPADAIAMDANIAKFTVAPEVEEKRRALREEHGIDVRPYTDADLFAYLDFMEREMPPAWPLEARHNLREAELGRFDKDSIWIAVRLTAGQVVGYCQHVGDHFGPFGVSDSCQGLGIGSVLLANTLATMRAKGCHCAWVLWTGDRAAKGVYGRLGFTITRRFAIMTKTLE
jgi:GNAT superfamily N-acetyltransferase